MSIIVSDALDFLHTLADESVLLFLAARLSRACPGWTLRESADGYVLTPPVGAEALIGTRAALEDWLRHQERWGRCRERAAVQLALFEEAA